MYSNDSAFILSFDIFKKNEIQKGLLDLSISLSDGTPLDKAVIRIFAADADEEYIIYIDAPGCLPAKNSNIRICPGYVTKLHVSLIPVPSRNHVLKHEQPVSLRKTQCIQRGSELSQDEVRDLTMQLGMVTPEGSPSYIYAKRFAEEVNNLSGGKIKIDINTEGKLGTDREMLQNILKDGNIDLIVQTTPPQVDFMPKLSVFDMPMVYTDENELRRVINNDEFYEKISDVYKNGGYKLLGFSDPLFRQLTTNKQIQNIEDFEGIRIRTIQNKNHEEFWRLLGAILVPLPFSEIYSSIQLGYIDSADNPYENIIALKLYEQQKYLVRTKHLPHLVNLITSNKYYNSLTSAEKAILEQAAANATAYVREGAEKSLEEREKYLMDKGMTILELSDETKQEMKSRALPVYDRVRKLVMDEELIDLYIGKGVGY